MSRPLVSVVIPTHNRAYCIADAIDSALGQTYPNVEAVVIDDGSTDDTAALIDKRYGGDARVRYVHQEKSGTNIARNHGLRLARGEFVALLDSDDFFLPWKIEMQVACLEAVPEAGMIWSDMDALNTDGSIQPRYLRKFYSNYKRFSTERLFASSRPLAEVVPDLKSEVGSAKLYHGDIFGPMVLGNLVHTSTSVLRRERLEKVRGFDESLVRAGVDFDFHLRTCREGPVAYADVSTIRYRVGLSDQMTHPSRKIKMAENFLRTIEPVIARDRARIDLPQAMIDEVIADGEEFIGEALIDLDDHAAARPHLLRSLRLRPLHPRTLRLFVLSLLPGASKGPIRRAYRALRALRKPDR